LALSLGVAADSNSRLYFLTPITLLHYPGFLLVLAGLISGARFLYIYIFDGGIGHIQSLILAAILIIVGFRVVLMILVSQPISLAKNRQIMEDMRYQSQLTALQKEQRS
jgi:hypothetical protein